MRSEEIVNHLFRDRWPRLYLDTAELNTIRRGQVPGDLVEHLLRVTEKHAVILVISLAHMRDAMKPGDADAPHLLASTLERFWMRGLVDLGPGAIEPWKDGPADIKPDPWGNVREFLTSPAAAPKLAELDLVQDTAYAGDVAMKATQRMLREGTRPNRRSDEELAIVVGAVKMLLFGLQPTIEGAIDSCAAIISKTLTSSEREALVRQALPGVAMAKMLSPLVDLMDPDQKLGAAKLSSAGRDVAPGTRLASKLFADR
jgi:hypothetical protein